MEVGVIVGNGCGIQGKNYVALPRRYSRGVKRLQDFTTLTAVVGLYLQNVIGLPTNTVTVV